MYQFYPRPTMAIQWHVRERGPGETYDQVLQKTTTIFSVTIYCSTIAGQKGGGYPSTQTRGSVNIDKHIYLSQQAVVSQVQTSSLGNKSIDKKI